MGVLGTDKRVKIWCDNRAVVNVIGGNRTRDGVLGAILWEILMVQARYNLQLMAQHVMGSSNEIANSHSRVHMRKSVNCRIFIIIQGVHC